MNAPDDFEDEEFDDLEEFDPADDCMPIRFSPTASCALLLAPAEDLWEPVMTRLRAAIAKAEGRS